MTTISQEPLNVIYGLRCTCHPKDGVRYVGQTSLGATRRMSAHKSHAISGGKKLPVYDWMRKHGRENIVMDTLDSCEDVDDLYRKEQEWIALLGTRVIDGRRGLNLTDGGCGTRGRVLTDAQRINLSQKHTGKVGSIGQSNGQSKLTEFDVVHIKQNIVDGFVLNRIAEVYHVSHCTISDIKRGKTWLHVEWPSPSGAVAEPRRWATESKSWSHLKNIQETKYSKSPIFVRDIRRVLLLRREGYTYYQISNMMPTYVTMTVAGKICRGEAWAWAG